MNAVPILLADAATAVLNTAVQASYFDVRGFTVNRSYPDWDNEFADLKSVAVDVVFVTSGGTDLVELDTEGTIDSGPAVDIAVRKRFEPIDREHDGRVKKSALDPLVRLVEQIHEKLAAGRGTALSLASGIDANWMDATVRTFCDYKRLREGVFLGVVRVRFDVSKEIP